jgi:acyl-CoA synthetase (AMP-forming)/AMP-acid ligase II
MRLIDYFYKGMERDPERIAFVDPDVTLRYREVDELSDRIASGLHSLGVALGDKIAVLSPNSALAFVCILGGVRLGGVWVPINVRNPVAVNAAFLKLVDCDVLFIHSSLESSIAEIRSLVPTLRTVIGIDGPVPDADLSLDALVARAVEDPPEVPDDPNRTLTIFPTGGTTGLSKAAVWTQRVWESVYSALWSSCPCTEPPVHLVAGPMTHAAGGIAIWLFPGGPTNVIVRKADPVTIMDAIEEHKVSHMYLPPTLIYMLLAHPDVRSRDFRSLKYLFVSAAPIAAEKLKEAMEVLGPCLCQAYGQAEAPQLITFLSTRDLLDAIAMGETQRFASCGRATLNTRVEIMDEAGALLPAGRKGEIVVRGSLVFPGYYKNPAATADVSTFGWHHTGDVGFKDPQGFVYIVDRKKDMIITGGFNVFSNEVEQVILSHPAVQECAVVGVPDEKWGEAIKAIVEVKPGYAFDAAALIEFVRERLGGVHAPKTVEVWAEIPRSPNGKVLKREVRQRYWEGQSRAV